MTEDLDQTLFVGVGGIVCALSVSDGRELWRTVLPHAGSIADTRKGSALTLVAADPVRSAVIAQRGAATTFLDALKDGAIAWSASLCAGFCSLGEEQQQCVCDQTDCAFAAGRDARAFMVNTSQVDAPPLPPPVYAANTISLSYASDTKKQPSLHNLVFVASNRGQVRCLDARTGVDLWMKVFGQHPSLCVQDGVLFVAGFGARICAINALSGIELWSKELHVRDHCSLATMRSGDPTTSIPYNRHRISSLTKFDISEALLLGTNGQLAPISKKTGKHFGVLPSFRPDGVGFAPVTIFPLPSEGSAILAAGATVQSVVLAEGTGRVVWENGLKGMTDSGSVIILVGAGVPPPSSRSAIPEDLPKYNKGGKSEVSVSSLLSVVNPTRDLFYISIRGVIKAINLADRGNVVWSFDPGFGHRMTVVQLFVEDTCLFVAGKSSLHCLDAITGRELWVSRTATRNFPFLATMRSGDGETNRTPPFASICWKSVASVDTDIPHFDDQ